MKESKLYNGLQNLFTVVIISHDPCNGNYNEPDIYTFKSSSINNKEDFINNLKEAIKENWEVNEDSKEYTTWHNAISLVNTDILNKHGIEYLKENELLTIHRDFNVTVEAENEVF